MVDTTYANTAVTEPLITTYDDYISEYGSYGNYDSQYDSQYSDYDSQNNDNYDGGVKSQGKVVKTIYQCGFNSRGCIWYIHQPIVSIKHCDLFH